MSKAVKIGPELPKDLAVTRVDASLPEEKQVAVVEGEGPAVVRTVDILGNIVETIMSVEKPKVETRAQVAARVVSKYTDAQGNVVETY